MEDFTRDYLEHARCYQLGRHVLELLDGLDLGAVDDEVNRHAWRAIERIGETLEDYRLDNETCLEALDAVADIDGEEGEYGYTLYTVNGVTAAFNTGNAYWAIYVNGEYGSYGLSQQPVNDGDAFSIVYETYAG